jgi:hypothetical protein
MMKYLILLLAPVSSAFIIKPIQPSFSWQLKKAKSVDASAAVGFDKDRAIECAQTFGRCSVEEVKNLRDCKLYIFLEPLSSPCDTLANLLAIPAIHDARVKNIVLSNVAGGTAHIEDILFEQRLLEDDLSLQLSLLQNEMPETRKSVLFPIEQELTMHPEHLAAPEAVVNSPALPVLDENLFDAVAICIVIGILAMAPHLLE